VIKSPKLYFADVGLASFLLGIHTTEQASRDPIYSSLGTQSEKVGAGETANVPMMKCGGWLYEMPTTDDSLVADDFIRYLELDTGDQSN
jgi:hypothetical protein